MTVSQVDQLGLETKKSVSFIDFYYDNESEALKQSNKKLYYRVYDSGQTQWYVPFLINKDEYTNLITTISTRRIFVFGGYVDIKTSADGETYSIRLNM